jgi:hypothetical protein
LENLKGRDHYGDLSIHIWKDNAKLDLRRIRCEKWTRFIWLKDQWWAFLCMVMNLWASQKTGNFLTSRAYRTLVGKPEGKTPLGRSRHSWVDNIKMDL